MGHHVPPLKALSFRRLGNLLSPFLTKVSLDYFVVTDHRLGRTACDQSSVVEHVKMVNQLNHRLHRVLDDQDGHALRANLMNGAEDAVEIVVAEPGEGLVEQGSIVVAARERGRAPSAAARDLSARQRAHWRGR